MRRQRKRILEPGQSKHPPGHPSTAASNAAVASWAALGDSGRREQRPSKTLSPSYVLGSSVRCIPTGGPRARRAVSNAPGCALPP